MCRGVLLLIAAVAVGTPAASSAQVTERRTFRRDIDHMLDDLVFIWTSPFHIQNDDLAGLAVVAGAFTTTLLSDRAVLDWVRAHPKSLPVSVLTPLRESSPLSRIGLSEYLIPFSSAIYLVGVVRDDDVLRDTGIGCVTSNVATTLSRYALANLVGRMRPRSNRGPYVIEPFAFGNWDMRSFPGGHAANIMSCASYWNHRFDLGYAEGFLYALAVLTGLGRVVDEAHWTSDTVFGLAWGYAVGKAIAARVDHRADQGAGGNQRSAVSIQSAPRVYLGWTLRF
jgi:membrane-associated phospholipid phosphatase